MTKYEALYIIAAEIGEEATKELIEKFNGIITANGGEVEETDEWGIKRLAYPINYKTEGYYVLVNFSTANNTLPAELERNFKINDSVIRFLVTKREA